MRLDVINRILVSLFMALNMAENAYFTRLENRGVVKIFGDEAGDFLQSLITNDIHLLDKQPMIYGCLLTPQGKFLHDFFITRPEQGVFVLDCEGGVRAQDLGRRLLMFKLRRQIDIEVQEQSDVFVGHGWAEGQGVHDPRHEEMGMRAFLAPEDGDEADFARWDRHRISLVVPDGSRDLLVEKSTMDEGRMDQLNAVNYDKGCYVGQELTARMHYRGLGKKHLCVVSLDDVPEKAELRSQCDDLAIALCRTV